MLSHVVILDQVVQTRVGIMTAGLIVVMFFGFAIFRIPPFIAAAAVTPYVGFGSYQLWLAYDDGRLNGVEAGGLAAAQWIAYLGCLLVCVVIEIVDAPEPSARTRSSRPSSSSCAGAARRSVATCRARWPSTS